jgi:hypothetical protein
MLSLLLKRDRREEEGKRNERSCYNRMIRREMLLPLVSLTMHEPQETNDPLPDIYSIHFDAGSFTGISSEASVCYLFRFLSCFVFTLFPGEMITIF